MVPGAVICVCKKGAGVLQWGQMNRWFKQGLYFCCLWVVCAVLVGCGREELPVINAPEDLAGRNVSTMTGAVFDRVLLQHIPTAKPYYESGMANGLQSLKSGKCDAIVSDEPVARDLMRENSGIRILCTLAPEEYAYLFSKDNAELCEAFSRAIRELEADGTIRKIDERWFGNDETVKLPPNLPPDTGKGTIVAATNSGFPPFSVVVQGRMAGYDPDILAEICRRLGYGLEFKDMEFSSVIPCVVSGKADLGFSGISVTPERKQSALFTEPVYKGGTVLIVRDASAGAAEGTWWQGVRDSFVRTFVTEARWQMILRGLGITLLIALCSIAAGTLLAMVVCAMRRSPRAWLRLPAAAYIAVMRGTPIVVVLMILYYIVFRSGGIGPVPVAIVGFALNFGAYSAETFRSGMNAIDPGQLEAAAAMGFSKWRSFLYISLPQAVRHVLPVYKGDIISIIKDTSIVGYIAIQDLTKVSDIIRGRTYEAFFPLVATAVIYFLLAYSISELVGLVERSIDPQRRRVSLDFIKDTPHDTH